MKVSIADCRPMQDRTAGAIVIEARKRGAFAAPVWNRKGQATEVHLFRDGRLQASIFRPAVGRLAVWRSNKDQALVPDVPTAVQRALDPLRKSQRKGVENPQRKESSRSWACWRGGESSVP